MAANLEAASPKMPAEINSATRSLHTHLNALITSRLPLVLPPHADSPLVYATGLIPFARIYLAFENAWDKACVQKLVQELRQHSSGSGTGSVWGEDIWVDVPLELLSQSQDLGESVEGDESRDVSENGQEASSTTTSMSSLPPLPDSPLTRSTLSHHQSLRLLRALRSLRPTGITRSARLRNDLAALLDMSVEEVDDLFKQTTDQEHPLFSIATDSFIKHIEQVTAEKPHVLIAYAFVLYMAVFSGGRWIRSVLSSAGSSFWQKEHAKNGEEETSEPEELVSTSSKSNTILLAPTPSTQVRLEKLGLSFWFFSSPTDGLDIKAEFKSRLDALEPLLTEEQRQDVVEEAREIFERCESLVADLDERVGRRGKLVEVIHAKQDALEADSSNAKESKILSQRHANASARVRVMMRGCQDASIYAGWALLVGAIGWYAMQAMEA